MKTYRTGFSLAVIGNGLLAIALVALWLHYRAGRPIVDAHAKRADSAAQDSITTAPPALTEAPLVPVQISPQRLQSIGVKTGTVERKLVADEIRTIGRVAGDDR